MSINEKRQRLVDAAVAYLGCKEVDGSHRKIIDAYNAISPVPRGYRMSYTDPWCAAFVSAMGALAGLGDIILAECSCDAMLALYKARGQWVEDDAYIPAPGDIVMYDWQDSGAGDCTGSADHVGIVVSVDGSNAKVIEGNISDAVGYRTLAINARYIRGYCEPDYGADSVSGGDTPPYGDGQSDETPSVTTVCNVKLPELQQGDSGEAVKAMQTLLILRGCPCGSVDGDFGVLTRWAVKSLQRLAGLDGDGICGALTWAALIGGAA